VLLLFLILITSIVVVSPLKLNTTANITIRADGSISSSIHPLKQAGKVYSLTSIANVAMFFVFDSKFNG
jgi:hypothetical protein